MGYTEMRRKHPARSAAPDSDPSPLHSNICFCAGNAIVCVLFLRHAMAWATWNWSHSLQVFLASQLISPCATPPISPCATRTGVGCIELRRKYPFRSKAPDSDLEMRRVSAHFQMQEARSKSSAANIQVLSISSYCTCKSLCPILTSRAGVGCLELRRKAALRREAPASNLEMRLVSTRFRTRKFVLISDSDSSLFPDALDQKACFTQLKKQVSSAHLRNPNLICFTTAEISAPARL